MKTLNRHGRIFDSRNPNWMNDVEMNLLYLRFHQAFFNDLLRSRGHLMLNEVYDRLDFPRTRSGWTAGWICDESNQVGDNFVNLGMEICEDGKADIMLNFNATENIIDVIFKEEEP